MVEILESSGTVGAAPSGMANRWTRVGVHLRVANRLGVAVDNLEVEVVLVTARDEREVPIPGWRFVLEFERPDAAARGRLWARLCDELLGADAARALALDLESLARQLELTGAQIKGALLTARLAARRGGAAPTAEHLLRGVERELNKEGRGLSDRDREGLSHGR